eukprot:CAMPEP_0114443772 /NCGR_PEP_ID=MMETSP0103-20121206/17712_1 /TAXON_ID=37642 ORGANISM="Paraphysomonas imperforata, Strain PA2" /NCGR_SAMPLE_ID=MMETSP0103 /ASSEMBLY_ACC=CAM_ASM_000201 /LENGTH=597 /DNA_ID=CAMNT_0001615227 /DNA_START=31 /DNA_END=1825 /DNA_ORIENTATION=+
MEKLSLLFVCGVVLCHAAPQLNFRRDNYLDEGMYPEGTWAPIPKEGGRVQIVSDVAKDLNLSYPLTVDLGSVDMVLASDQYPDHVPSDGLDWVHSRYNSLTGTLLTSFHMHTDDKINSISKLKVYDSKGVVIVNDAMTVAMETPQIQVTYVTSRNNFQELVVHFHNYDTNDHTIDTISINSGFYSIDGFKIKAGEHAVKVYDAKELKLKEVSVWTVALTWGDDSAAFGGRLIKELFPIEDWPKSSQCPYPVDGADEENFEIQEMSYTTAESNGDWYVLANIDFFEDHEIPDGAYPGIAAAFLGDESDSSVEKTWDVWQRVMRTNEDYAEYATYDGGHSNHLNGQYAGVTDIQGMDFYVAACAPHITMWTSTMYLRGSYDYLYNTRQNMRPLPSWLYSQGWCADCWSVKDLEAGEMVVQLASVIASGGKGLMLFESDITLRGGESWEAGGKFLHSVKFIGEFLRQADVDGALFTTSAESAITQVLNGPSELLFIAISTDASGYDDKTCIARNSHWIFEEQTIDQTEISIPSNLKEEAEAAGKSIKEYFKAVEVVNGSYDESPSDVEMSLNTDSSTWNINSLKLGTTATTARMFMLVPK